MPSGTLTIGDVRVALNTTQPTNITPDYGNASDTDAGASLDFSSIEIVTQPKNGTVEFDVRTGTFTYTPNYLATYRRGDVPPNILPESFQFTIKDSDGNVSNTVTVTFTGTVVMP